MSRCLNDLLIVTCIEVREAALLMSHAARIDRLNYIMRGIHPFAIKEAKKTMLMRAVWSFMATSVNF